jgi:hypothetical protein
VRSSAAAARSQAHHCRRAEASACPKRAESTTDRSPADFEAQLPTLPCHPRSRRVAVEEVEEGESFHHLAKARLHRDRVAVAEEVEALMQHRYLPRRVLPLLRHQFPQPGQLRRLRSPHTPRTSE